MSVPHQLVGAPLGSTVTLDCGLESSPAAVPMWKRGDGEGSSLLLHDASKYRLQSAPAASLLSGGGGGGVSPYRTHLRLMIINVTDKDYGGYRCAAANPFGEADGVIKLYRKLAHLIVYRIFVFNLLPINIGR